MNSILWLENPLECVISLLLSTSVSSRRETSFQIGNSLNIDPLHLARRWTPLGRGHGNRV